eukprot:CCRYP_012739-RD/>CCRYP_012739-RD protein AED:0.48 eAED:0.62 QI:0/0/0/1/0/0/3/0/85
MSVTEWHADILNGGCNMLEGSAQYDRFNAIFRSIVRVPCHRDFFIALGIHPEYSGTHSIRKGALTTYCFYLYSSKLEDARGEQIH